MKSCVCDYFLVMCTPVPYFFLYSRKKNISMPREYSNNIFYKLQFHYLISLGRSCIVKKIFFCKKKLILNWSCLKTTYCVDISSLAFEITEKGFGGVTILVLC